MDRNGLYIVFHGFADYSGITLKIHAQVKAFKECGINMQLCYQEVSHDATSLVMIDKITLYSFGKGLKSKILKRFNLKPIENYILNNNISFVYIRHYANASPFLISFIRKLRNNGIKVVLEIPTYPYDSEFKEAGAEDRIKHIIDKIYRDRLGRNLDYICTFTDNNQIFGCNTIKLSNGIDFERTHVRKMTNKENNDINLIAIGELHYWHGFDRILQGLSKYYESNPNRKVFLHIVGKPTTESGEELKSLANRLGINEYIIFHGPMSGDPLDKLFNICDVGIGSLGRHRSNIDIIKPLKNREYAARGIPFIYSERDPDFEAQPYVLKMPANETAIPIKDIIKFYDSFALSPEEIRSTIDPALSWNSQIKKIIETCYPTA